MRIKLYYNSSDRNVVNKSTEFISQITVNSHIEKPLIDMQITLPKDQIYYSNMANYVEIVDFNRKYFITDVKKDIGGVVTISLHQDILSSHFDKIKNINCWILRQEHKANLYVDDDEIIVQNRSDQVVLKFPNTFGVDSNGTPVGTNVMLVLGSAQIIKEG